MKFPQMRSVLGYQRTWLLQALPSALAVLACLWGFRVYAGHNSTNTTVKDQSRVDGLGCRGSIGVCRCHGAFIGEAVIRRATLAEG